jgi:hypothetical protein
VGARLPGMELVDGVFECHECGSEDGPHYVHKRRVLCIKCDCKRMTNEMCAMNAALGVAVALAAIVTVMVVRWHW